MLVVLVLGFLKRPISTDTRLNFSKTTDLCYTNCTSGKATGFRFSLPISYLFFIWQYDHSSNKLNTSESCLCCWYDSRRTGSSNWKISMISIQTLHKGFIRWKQNNCTRPLRSLKTFFFLFLISVLADVDPRRSVKEPLSYIQSVSKHPFFMLINMKKTQNSLLKGRNEQNYEIRHFSHQT